MHDLTGFQRDLLYVIAGSDEPNGLGIKRDLESYYRQPIHHSRLYTNLNTLVRKGLVRKGEQTARSNFYTVTPRGSREIESRREWEQQYLESDLEVQS